MTLTKYESSGPCGFGEDFFYFLISSHDAIGAWPHWPVWPPRARWAGFIKRTFTHSYTQNRKALGLVVLEKIFLCFPIECLW